MSVSGTTLTMTGTGTDDCVVFPGGHQTSVPADNTVTTAMLQDSQWQLQRLLPML